MERQTSVLSGFDLIVTLTPSNVAAKPFEITTATSGHEIKVQRSLQDFHELNLALVRSGVKVPVLPAKEDVLQLSEYLARVVRGAVDGNYLWNLPSLLSFLDDGYCQSLLGSLHLDNLNARIRQLEMVQERNEYRTDELAQCLQLIVSKLTLVDSPTNASNLAALSSLNSATSPVGSSGQTAAGFFQGPPTPTGTLTETNLRTMTARMLDKLISPRGLTRLSIQSVRTNDSGRSASFASNSFDNDLVNPSRRESRMTDISDSGDTHFDQDSPHSSSTGGVGGGVLGSQSFDLSAAAINHLNSDSSESADSGYGNSSNTTKDSSNRGLTRGTSVSKLFYRMSYVGDTAKINLDAIVHNSNINNISSSSIDLGGNEDDTSNSSLEAMAAALAVPPSSSARYSIQSSSTTDDNNSSKHNSYNSNHSSDYSMFPSQHQDPIGSIGSGARRSGSNQFNDNLLGPSLLFGATAGAGVEANRNNPGGLSLNVDTGSQSAVIAQSTGAGGAGSSSSTNHASYLLNNASALANLFNTLNEHVHSINALITMISPHDEQRSHRNSIRAVIARQLKRSANARVIEIGLHALDCFLPDDVLRLCPVLWRSNIANWQTLLLDRLLRLTENPSEVNELLSTNHEDEDSKSVADISDNPPYKVTADHVISAAIVASVNGESQVQVGVDSVHVEVVPYSKMDQLLLALMEDVSLLVGQQNLFKRSLTIIRSWWVYETTSYIGCAMKHYLSEFTIAVMVCAVFNQYHNIITEPFHALYLFLLVYAEMDWRSAAVCINGTATFGSDLDLIPTITPPTTFTPLINPALIAKYSASLCSPPSSQRNSGALSETASASTPTPTSQLSSLGAIGETLSPGRIESPGHNSSNLSMLSHTTSATSNNNTPSSTGAGGGGTGITSTTPIHAIGFANFELFERREINIVNPINNSNMVTDKLNTRRAKRIIKVFQMGSRNLQVALRNSSGGGGGGGSGISNASASLLDSHSPLSPRTPPPPSHGNTINSGININMSFGAMQLFFKGIANRFEAGWRPDAPGHSLVENKLLIESDPNKLKRLGLKKNSSMVYQLKSIQGLLIDHLWRQINYCSFMIEGTVTESALMIICTEILIDRGTLPVGEIGKILQELTAVPNFSNKLKEKFGGLKKFLEKYPDSFVISTDHPFNPHVFLKKLLSPEDLEVINRGIVPPQLTARFKKPPATTKKPPKPIPTVAIPGDTGSGGGAAGNNSNNVSSPGASTFGAMSPPIPQPPASGGGNSSNTKQQQQQVQQRPIGMHLGNSSELDGSGGRRGSYADKQQISSPPQQPQLSSPPQQQHHQLAQQQSRNPPGFGYGSHATNNLNAVGAIGTSPQQQQQKGRPLSLDAEFNGSGSDNNLTLQAQLQQQHQQLQQHQLQQQQLAQQQIQQQQLQQQAQSQYSPFGRMQHQQQPSPSGFGMNMNSSNLGGGSGRSGGGSGGGTGGYYNPPKGLPSHSPVGPAGPGPIGGGRGSPQQLHHSHFGAGKPFSPVQPSGLGSSPFGAPLGQGQSVQNPAFAAQLAQQAVAAAQAQQQQQQQQQQQLNTSTPWAPSSMASPPAPPVGGPGQGPQGGGKLQAHQLAMFQRSNNTGQQASGGGSAGSPTVNFKRESSL